MGPQAKRILHWAPRVLGIAFPLFVALFALDVFGPGRGFWRTALALLMHLIPSFALAGALLIAWRWRRTGALLYAALGLAYVVMSWGKVVLAAHAAIAGPPLLAAALLLLDWRYDREGPGSR